MASRTAARPALASSSPPGFSLWLLWGYRQTLSKVRTNVLLGSIYLCDALIDDAASRRDEYRAELSRLREMNEQALAAYLPEVGSEVERQHWAHLQAELAEFWASRDLALTDSEPRTSAQAAALLRTRVVPRRETILQVLDQLAALQAEACGACIRPSRRGSGSSSHNCCRSCAPRSSPGL